MNELEIEAYAKTYIKSCKEELSNNKFEHVFGESLNNIDKQHNGVKQKVFDIIVRRANVNIFKSLTKVRPFAFKGLNLPSVIILPEVTGIGASAFENTNIETIIAPKCKFISSQAFYNCSNLITVEFNEVEAVQTGAFSGTAITEINLPKATKFDLYVFEACTKLKTVRIPEYKGFLNTIFATSDVPNIKEVVIDFDKVDEASVDEFMLVHRPVRVIDYNTREFKETMPIAHIE